MKSILKTNIICFDEHRHFTAQIKNSFSDTDRYHIASFNNRQAFTDYCKKVKDDGTFNIAIIGLFEFGTDTEFFENLMAKIGEAAGEIHIIVIASPCKIEYYKDRAATEADVFIPYNSNAILRVRNAVQRMIAGYHVVRLEKCRNNSLSVMAVFLFVGGLLLLLVRLKWPVLF